MSGTEVSVVIPVVNEGETIVRTLAAVREVLTAMDVLDIAMQDLAIQNPFGHVCIGALVRRPPEPIMEVEEQHRCDDCCQQRG